jgi:Mg-chelatase subunit ChlD
MGSNLELDTGDNIIFGLDISASMQTTDTPTGAMRIDYAKEKAITLAQEASKYDADGIDLLTFGHSVTPYKNVSADKAAEVIGKLRANEGATQTHLLIQEAYKLHKASGSEQTVLMIVTDGQPSDPAAVKSTIVGITKELKNEHEFAISILTVGNPDAGLTTFLTSLDDDLKGAAHDIVDVKKLEEVDFVSAFSGALHD